MADEKAIAETSAKSSIDGGDQPAVPHANYLLKLDLRLIPILGCTYTLLFLDRTNSMSLSSRSSRMADVIQSPMRGLRAWRRA